MPLAYEIVTPKKLKEFSLKHPNAKAPLLYWYSVVKNSEWNSLHDIKQDFNHVDYVGNNRYVFNIKGNDYRLIAIVILISNKVYIRFIGTHDNYNKIDASKV